MAPCLRAAKREHPSMASRSCQVTSRVSSRVRHIFEAVERPVERERLGRRGRRRRSEQHGERRRVDAISPRVEVCFAAARRLEAAQSLDPSLTHAVVVHEFQIPATPLHTATVLGVAVVGSICAPPRGSPRAPPSDGCPGCPLTLTARRNGRIRVLLPLVVHEFLSAWCPLLAIILIFFVSAY